MANQAWQIAEAGKLELVDLGSTLPSPGPRQALVRIEAVSLNYRDVLVAAHSKDYPVQAKPGLVPCSDGAGVVEAAGPESRWRAGDRVLVHPSSWLRGNDVRDFAIDQVMGGGTVDGTLRRWLVRDDDRLVPAPEGYAAAELATFFTAGVTAWNALFHAATRLAPGMTVLTQGTGGVSCYAIMIAAAHGATVIATSSSDAKLRKAQQLGATHLINYREHPDWATEVLRVTDGRGVDMVVDVIGAQSIEETIRATRFGGHISLVGMLSKDPDQTVNVMTPLLYGAKTLQGVLGAGSMDMTRELAAFAQAHKLRPPIAETFEFEQAEKAFEALTGQTGMGKIVIKV